MKENYVCKTEKENLLVYSLTINGTKQKRVQKGDIVQQRSLQITISPQGNAQSFFKYFFLLLLFFKGGGGVIRIAVETIWTIKGAFKPPGGLLLGNFRPIQSKTKKNGKFPSKKKASPIDF